MDDKCIERKGMCLKLRKATDPVSATLRPIRVEHVAFVAFVCNASAYVTVPLEGNLRGQGISIFFLRILAISLQNAFLNRSFHSEE